jgi:hypothetical protein
MSTFRILSDNLLIGQTDLEYCDQGMNVYSGYFRAAPDYARVRSVFKLFSAALDLDAQAQGAALEQYYRQRDDLLLTVRDQDDVLVPTSWIHILDLEEDMNDLRIEVWADGSIGGAMTER